MLTIPQAQALIKQFYGTDAKPAQAEIFAAVFDMTKPRVAILGATQIQKSRATAQAIGLLATLGVGITIVGPKEEQALTPLQYFIGMIGNNKYFQNLMLQGGEEKVRRLQAQESKSFISFVDNGHLRAVTLNERDDTEKRRTTLGKGDQVIVFEEASLTSNMTEAMVLRMIAGWGYAGRIVKLGNAITMDEENDHFYRATEGEDGYYVIRVDYHRALEEGIYTPEFIEQAKKRPFFDSLYACIFPPASTVIKGGYTRMFGVDEIIEAVLEEDPKECDPDYCREHNIEYERPVGGLDIGQGKPDTTSLVFRWPKLKFAKKVFESTNPDVMSQIGEYSPVLDRFNPRMVNVDATGIGAAVAPRLSELNYPAYAVLVGAEAPKDPLTGKSVAGVANLKAYAYREVEDWIKQLLGKLGAGKWSELKEVAYKVRSDKNIIIESKEELQERHVPSYNDAEALMLTFVNQSKYNIADDLGFG